MRHNYKGRKLGTDSSHTRAMRRSLTCALLLNDRIKTVEQRAKEIRPDVDHIITWAKKGDLHSRRLAIAALGDKEVVREVFEKAAQGMWADRNGGYTRIYKLGNRKGDNAPMVIMEIVSEAVAPAEKKEEKKATPKKVSPKPVKAEEEAEETAEEKAAEEATEEKAEEATDEKPAEAAEEKAEEAGAAEEEKPAEEEATEPAEDKAAEKAEDKADEGEEKAEDAE
jgi:large subunit ribosomal protein L17